MRQRLSVLPQRHVPLNDFLPLAVRYDGSGGSTRFDRKAAPKRSCAHVLTHAFVGVRSHGYQVHVGPMNSNSRGTKILYGACGVARSCRQTRRFNYLLTPQDEEEWVQAIQKARLILSQPAFDKYNGGETSPGASVCSREDVLEWVRRDGETA